MGACAIPMYTRPTDFKHPLGILADSDLLSQESARGYLSVLGKSQFNRVVVVIGGRQLSAAALIELRAHVAQGSGLIWEAAPGHDCRLQLATLGVRTLPPFPVSAFENLYVRYSNPKETLVRRFESITPVREECGTGLAHYAGYSIATKRRVGSGRVMFLGSMLGPHLLAEDREARVLARHLLSSGSTSW